MFRASIGPARSVLQLTLCYSTSRASLTVYSGSGEARLLQPLPSSDILCSVLTAFLMRVLLEFPRFQSFLKLHNVNVSFNVSRYLAFVSSVVGDTLALVTLVPNFSLCSPHRCTCQCCIIRWVLLRVSTLRYALLKARRAADHCLAERGGKACALRDGLLA